MISRTGKFLKLEFAASSHCKLPISVETCYWLWLRSFISWKASLCIFLKIELKIHKVKKKIFAKKQGKGMEKFKSLDPVGIGKIGTFESTLEDYQER